MEVSNSRCMVYKSVYNDEEEWKLIENANVLPDFYEISTYGRIRIKGKNSIVMLHDYDKYVTVNLKVVSGGKKDFFVHDLMGEAFLEKGENDVYVLHKNGRRDYNHYKNLYYSSNYSHVHEYCKRPMLSVFSFLN